jgi:uncharacterized Tic20 family protein
VERPIEGLITMSIDDQPIDTSHEQPIQASELISDAKTWGMLCHLSAFGGYVFPFGNIVGPLIVWQIKKDEYEFVDDQGKEALNFQITITIAVLVSVILCFLLIGFLILPAILLFNVVMKVIGAVKAGSGERFRYPLSIRLIK